MENMLTAAELKRRGMAAIEAGLKRGPVQLFKRNKPAAVVLTPADYQHLLHADKRALPGMTALEWLLSQADEGKLTKSQIDQRLRDERSW